MTCWSTSTNWPMFYSRIMPRGIYLGCPNKEYLLIYREGKFKYLSEVEWKAKNWPPFQDGFFALMSMDVIRNMFLLSCKTPMTWPDDVYIGALAVMLNLPLLGYQDHCVGIGHKPHWNISETTLAKVLEETSPVMLAHFWRQSRFTQRWTYLNWSNSIGKRWK